MKQYAINLRTGVYHLFKQEGNNFKVWHSRRNRIAEHWEVMRQSEFTSKYKLQGEDNEIQI